MSEVHMPIKVSMHRSTLVGRIRLFEHGMDRCLSQKRVVRFREKAGGLSAECLGFWRSMPVFLEDSTCHVPHLASCANRVRLDMRCSYRRPVPCRQVSAENAGVVHTHQGSIQQRTCSGHTLNLGDARACGHCDSELPLQNAFRV